MLESLLGDLFALDAPFVAMKHGTPPHASLGAFENFLSWSEAAPFIPQLTLSDPSWTGICGQLAKVKSGEFDVPSRAEITAMSVASTQLASRDPIAGVMVALFAVAAWEGALGPDRLYEQPMHGPDLGWGSLPANLGEVLLAADAVWSASNVVTMAAEMLEAAKLHHFDEKLRRASTDCRRLLARIDGRLTEARADLAWDLRMSCDIKEPNFRAEVAALFWVAGDPIHAELFSNPDWIPPKGVLDALV